MRPNVQSWHPPSLRAHRVSDDHALVLHRVLDADAGGRDERPRRVLLLLPRSAVVPCGAPPHGHELVGLLVGGLGVEVDLLQRDDHRTLTLRLVHETVPQERPRLVSVPAVVPQVQAECTGVGFRIACNGL